MIRTVKLFAILFTLVATLATTARAQGNSVRGKIRNSSGQNVARVIVHIETGNGAPINTTVTNNEGDFEFSGLGGTSFILTIDAPDYQKVTQHVEFVRNTGPEDPGEHRTVDIVLVPKAGASLSIPANRTVSAQNVPKAARDALERAAKLSKENKSQEAIAAMQEAIAAYPQYFEAHLLLAGELMKLGRLDEAIAEFEQARKVNAKDDRVYQGFGQVLMMQKKYALASNVFGEAARLNPADANLPLLRAGALIEHAVAINPSASKEAAAERQNAFALAEKDLGKALELSGNKLAAVHLQAAKLYEKKGDRTRAANELELYLRMVPDDKRAETIRSAIKTLRAPLPEKKP